MKKSFLGLICGLLFSACNGGFGLNTGIASAEELFVVNWNVQTFFDSTKDGCEYEEFLSSKTWGLEAYTERLKKLASAIKMLDADVLVMEEIENENVLHDISNFLAGEWNQKKIYRYACFAKEKDGAIGCGVLSRYPLENLSVHALDIRVSDQMPKMRPLMQLTVKKGEKNLTLFVNHWKSMSGGEAETDFWRLWQESVLSKKILSQLDKGDAILVCGDFNRDIQTFKKSRRDDLILLRNQAEFDCDEGVEVLSPWFDEKMDLINPGSYFFENQWSRIDNFFACGLAEIVDFYPATNGPWCNEINSIPDKYQIWNGQGYSDHLPICCRVCF